MPGGRKRRQSNGVRIKVASEPRPAALKWLVRRLVFFFQAEDGIRDSSVTGVQTCALPIYMTITDSGSDLNFSLTEQVSESVIVIYVSALVDGQDWIESTQFSSLAVKDLC